MKLFNSNKKSNLKEAQVLALDLEVNNIALVKQSLSNDHLKMIGNDLTKYIVNRILLEEIDTIDSIRLKIFNQLEIIRANRLEVLEKQKER